MSSAALIISVIALLQAHNSNTIALQANQIAMKQVDTSKDGNEISRNNDSNALINAAYQQIYDHNIMQAVRDKIQAKETVLSSDNLVQFVDIFEGIGTDFCNGLVYRRHIQPKLSYEIGHVCSNQQVYKAFVGHKNGLAMLCTEFIHQPSFGQTLKTESLSQCHFLDSQVLTAMQ